MRLYPDAQQIPRYGNPFALNFQRLNTWPDVVLQCKFDGANHATTAVDESLIGAPLTFNGAAEISTDAINDDFYQIGAVPSLKWATAGSHVTAPANDAYNFPPLQDFTIEFFYARLGGPEPWPYQFIGVWDESDIAKQSWRIIGDDQRGGFYFQWREGGLLRTHVGLASLPTSRWNLLIVSRIGTKVGDQNAQPTRLIVGSTPLTWNGAIDPPQSPTPLRVGGGTNPAAPGSGGSLYISKVRITRAAQYPQAGTGTYPLFGDQQITGRGWGIITPPLIGTDDIFHAPRATTGPTPALVASDDVFYSPLVAGGAPKVLSPAKFTDVDNFRTPPGVATSQGFLTYAPGYPRVTGDQINLFPTIVNDAVTSGHGRVATLALPPDLEPGNVLLAIIQTKNANRHFSINGWPLCAQGMTVACPGWDGPTAPPPSGDGTIEDPDWYIDDYYTLNGTSTWAFHYVNGQEFPPVFTWPVADGACDWFGRVIQVSQVEPNWPFCGGYQMFSGSGSRIYIQPNAEPSGLPPCPILGSTFLDIAGTYPGLLLMALTANNNQVIPTPMSDFYTPYAQRSDDSGSQKICWFNQPNFLQGSGIPDVMLQSGAVWSIMMWSFVSNRIQQIFTPHVASNFPPAAWVGIHDQLYLPVVTHT
jgi:hypothetical protein